MLKGIDLVARRNETTVIIGGSGAGKTTLLRHIVGLERPTSGEIYIAGENIVGLSERELNRVRQKLGMVYQDAALLYSISIFDNVAFPLVERAGGRERKMSRKEIKEKVEHMLSQLGLEPKQVRRSSRASSPAACASASGLRAR